MQDVCGSTRRLVSLYVVRPQFSIAPLWKSGMATRSVTNKKKRKKWAVYQDKNRIKQYLALVEDRGYQSIFHKNPSSWQRLPGRRRFAATSQHWRRRTPADTHIRSRMHASAQGCHIADGRISRRKTCTPEDVVAVTDLKSQMMKATRYVLIFTLTWNWSSKRPLWTSTVLACNSQMILPWFFSTHICRTQPLAYIQHSPQACWTRKCTPRFSWSSQRSWL